MEVELPGEHSTVKVASLASIVVLKAVAWLERPHERTRDLRDLATVFRAALAKDDERRWGTHTVATSGLEFDKQSAFFVGLEVSAVVRPMHRTQLDELVAKLLGDGPHAALISAARTPICSRAAWSRRSRVASGTRTVPRDEGSNSTASAGQDPGGRSGGKERRRVSSGVPRRRSVSQLNGPFSLAFAVSSACR